MGEVNLLSRRVFIDGTSPRPVIQEITPSNAKQCGLDIPDELKRIAANDRRFLARTLVRPAQYLVVTVGVFWTRAARLGANNGNEAGSQEEMARQIRWMAFSASYAFYAATSETGSPFIVRLDVTPVQEVNYQESGDDATDLVRLRDNLNDGFLDEIPRIREQRRFDAAILLVENLDSGGLASVMSEATKDTFAPLAYGVVERNSGI